jgi:outer membrane protein
MKRSFTSSVTILSVLLAAGSASAQRAPASPNQPWQSTLSVPAPARSVPVVAPDPAKTYVLAELINFAEQNNPETRVAWENAKAKAADLGVSKSTLYPTVAAAVVAQGVRTNLLLNTTYVRQTLESYAPSLELDYTIFDFGRRLDEIAVSKNELLAANLLFNDTHRKIIYQVMAAYYRVLNTKGQEDVVWTLAWPRCPMCSRPAARLRRQTMICRPRWEPPRSHTEI